MNLQYINDELHFGLTPVNLKKFTQDYQGPFYIYDLEGIAQRFQQWSQALPKGTAVHYAVKANANFEVLGLLKSLGAHVDVVSAGEIQKVLDAGFVGRDIIFSGVGKTIREIEFALDKNIYQINVESPSELRRIAAIAKRQNKKAPISLRYNPDVNPETHPYITTGFRENKFGLDDSLMVEAFEILQQNSDTLQLMGLTLHIGSQILDLEVYREAIQKTKVVFQRVQEMGFQPLRFDIGGGVGIHYQEQRLSEELQFMQCFGQMVQEELGGLNVEIQTEPGRWIVGHAGVLVTQVQYLKKTPHKNFAIVDSGMHQLMRPALYGAYHGVWPFRRNPAQEKVSYDVVGPICESSDFFAKNRELSELEEGDYLVVADAGAYGYSMASSYNAHSLPKEYCLVLTPGFRSNHLGDLISSHIEKLIPERNL